MSIDKMIADLVKREGGYVNRSDDKGGATKYGITLETLGLWRKDHVSVKDVMDLTEQEATEIYRKEYLKDPRINEIIDLQLQAMVFDFAVNSGAGNAIKALQECVGTNPDGKLGDITLKAINLIAHSYTAHPQTLRKQYLGKRLVFIINLVIRKPTQIVFLKGWGSRLIEILMVYV